LLGEDFLLFLDFLASFVEALKLFIETRNLFIDCRYLLFDTSSGGIRTESLVCDPK